MPIRPCPTDENMIQGGTIRGSINLPAQSLYPALPTVYSMVKAAGICRVVWYCCRLLPVLRGGDQANVLDCTASSRGRGTRAAGWFCDYLEKKGDESVQSLIVLEEVRGWVKGGAEFINWIDGYDKAYWEETL